MGSSETAFAASIRRARAEGRDLIDLTISNPTVCGFEYDVEKILTPLSNPQALGGTTPILAECVRLARRWRLTTPITVLLSILTR